LTRAPSVNGALVTDDERFRNEFERDLERARRNSPEARARDAERMLTENPDRMGLPYTWARDFGKLVQPASVVDQVLAQQSLAAVYGPPGSGKTSYVLDMALHVSIAQAWRGLSVDPGCIVWHSLESALSVRMRVAAKCLQAGWDPAALAFADVRKGVSFLEVGDIERVCTTVEIAQDESGQPCRIVVVDTLARAMPGGDENKTSDMGLLVRGCDIIRERTGAAVLLVHHSGKDPARGARGSGSLRAALDTEIEVSGEANPRQAKVTKQRDLPCGQAYAFDLEPVEIGQDPRGRPITACVVVHREEPVQAFSVAPKGKAQAAILRALRAQQDEHRKAGKPDALIWTIEDMRSIGRNLGQHRNSAKDAVDALITNGLLRPTVGGHRLTEAKQ
jgi:hypothetical protein